MGFYLRKSQRVGPFRINLSKSGIGISTGVKGLRISQGPRGAMVHMGRHGMYYRKSLGRPTATGKPAGTARGTSGDLHRSLSRSQPEQGLAEIDSASAETIVDTNSQALVDLIRDTRGKPRLIWLTPLPLLAGLIFPTALVGLMPFTALFALVAALLDKRRRTTTIAYSISDEMESVLQEFYDAFDTVFSSKAVWNVAAETDGPNLHKAGRATHSLQLEPVRVNWGQPKGINTNVRVPSLPVGRQVLHFLPDMVLVDEKTHVGAVSYKHLKIEESITEQAEYGGVPSDAEVVRITWKHANKDGSPDRRFKSNREIPVVKYLQIRLTSDTGLQELSQVSNASVQGVLSSAVAKLASIIPETTS